MSEWISVNERLPRNGEIVIVSGGIAYLRFDQWHTLTAEPWPGRTIQWNVTHWQPLPYPPEAK